jgi:GNAT superfamily N-acetyltransferase
MSTSIKDPLDSSGLESQKDKLKNQSSLEAQWSVRTAVRNDIDSILRFTLDEAIEAEGRVENPDQVKEAIRLAIEDPVFKAHYLVVSPQNNSTYLQGHCSITREWSDWNCTYYWWITSMYVEPHGRGKGAMQALLQEVDRLAALDGVPEVRIYVHTRNQRATRAWQREGFAECDYWMGARKIKPLKAT